MTPRTIFRLLKETALAWTEDKAMSLGAALAYYSVFSATPLLVIAIAIAGVVFGEQAAEGRIVQQIHATVGEPAAQALEALLANAGAQGTGVIATVVGIVLLLFGASGVFSQLQDSLNTIWKVTPKPGRGLATMVRGRFLAFIMVLIIGFLLLVSLAATATLAALSKWSSAAVGDIHLYQIINAVISLIFITVLLAMIYKILPDVKIKWKDVWVGAAFTAFLFTIGKNLLGLYLGRSSVTSVYGAAGSVVVILLWVYYSSLIVLFGAEFTRVFANFRGAQILPAENAVAVIPARVLAEGTVPQVAAR
jgi:membrane protein